MSAPCMCWAQVVSLHDGHCCMFDGTTSTPTCHQEVEEAAVRRPPPVKAPACGCLGSCPHQGVTA